MKHYKYIILIALTVSITIKGWSQEKNVDNQFNSWWANVNKYTVSDKVSFGTELHVRRNDFVANWQQFVFRPSINYKFNNNITVTLGYTNIHTWPYGDKPIAIKTPENNIWQQLLLTHKVGEFTFKHRYRLEERFMGKTVFNNGKPEIDGTNYGQRFRYRFIISFPIYKINEKQSIFFTGYDEIFLLLNDGFSINQFNQNWTLLAFGFHATKKLIFQVGYRNQWIKKGDNIHYENNHTLDVAIKYHFDFRKKISE